MASTTTPRDALLGEIDAAIKDCRNAAYDAEKAAAWATAAVNRGHVVELLRLKAQVVGGVG